MGFLLLIALSYPKPINLGYKEDSLFISELFYILCNPLLAVDLCTYSGFLLYSVSITIAFSYRRKVWCWRPRRHYNGKRYLHKRYVPGVISWRHCHGRHNIALHIWHIKKPFSRTFWSYLDVSQSYLHTLLIISLVLDSFIWIL